MNTQSNIASIGIPVTKSPRTPRTPRSRRIASSYPARPAPLETYPVDMASPVYGTYAHDDSQNEENSYEDNNRVFVTPADMDRIYQELEDADETMAAIRGKSCYQAFKVLLGGLIIVGGIVYFMTGLTFTVGSEKDEDGHSKRMPVWAVIVSVCAIGIGVVLATSGSKNASKLHEMEEDRSRQLRRIIRVAINTADRDGFQV